VGNLSGDRGWRRFLRTTVVVPPSAGADWSYKIPGAELHQLLTVQGTLVASAAVANRYPSLAMGDGTTVYARSRAAGAVVAGSTSIVLWTEGAYPGAANGILGSYLPTAMMSEGETIASVTDGLDVADQWSAIIIRSIVTQVKYGEIYLDDVPEMAVYVVNSPSE